MNNPNLILVLAVSTGISQTACLLLATRKYNPLELFPMVMLLWMVQYPISGLSIFLFDLPLKYQVTYTYLGFAARLANTCQLIVAFVWQLPLWPKIAGYIPIPSFPSVSDLIGLFTVLWVLSLTLRIILLFSGYQSGFEIEHGALNIVTNITLILLSLLSIIPIIYFCLLLEQDRFYSSRMAILVLAIEVILVTFFSGSKAGPVILIINFAVAYHYVIAPIKLRKIWAYFLISIILVIPFYAIKSQVRYTLLGAYSLSEERPNLTINDYMMLYVDSIDTLSLLSPEILFKETTTGLINRFDALTTLACTIAYYDRRNSYDFEMYLPLWVKPYVPRFLWVDKGWVGLGLFVSNEILGIRTYTHGTVSSPIEGYIACGTLGSLVLSIIHGAFVCIAISYFNQKNSNAENFFPKAYFVSSFLVLLYFTGAFVFIRNISFNFIILLAVIKIYHSTKLSLGTRGNFHRV